MEEYQDAFNPYFLSNLSKKKIQDNECTQIPPLPANAAVTMAYVPLQQDITAYEPSFALIQGTLFPELDKPFNPEGRGVAL